MGGGGGGGGGLNTGRGGGEGKGVEVLSQDGFCPFVWLLLDFIIIFSPMLFFLL